MEAFKLQAEPRKELGKAATKAVRRENRIPCVLYGGDEIQHFTLAPLDLRELVYSPAFKVVEITIDGQAHRCILKDVHYHPVNENILHIDFLRLIEDHPVKVDVPVSFEGAAVGLKSGGKLIKKLRKVTIKTTPENLIDKIVLDTSDMELGHTQRIRDLNVSEEIEILNNESIPVASIGIPRALRLEEPTAATPAEGAAAAPAAVPGKEGAPAKEEAPAKDAGKAGTKEPSKKK